MEKLTIPDFDNEGQEAQWWDTHKDEVADEFERAAEDGTLGRGTVAKKGATPTTTIRLSSEDLNRARQQAERRGLRYQTYLKMLIREALLKEERKAS